MFQCTVTYTVYVEGQGGVRFEKKEMHLGNRIIEHEINEGGRL